MFNFRSIRHTPTVIQMESLECGAAALSIVFQYHGCYVPMEVLREECGVSQEGSKASHILKCARKYGFEAKGYKKDNIRDLMDLEAPYIVFWQFNHYLVVEGFEKYHVRLNDPSKGRIKMTYDEFDKSFTGVCLTIKPQKTSLMWRRRAGVWSMLGRYFLHEKQAVFLLIGLSFFRVFPVIGMISLTYIFVNDVVVANPSNWVVPLTVCILVFSGLNLILTNVQSSVMNRLYLGVSTIQSSRLMWRLFNRDCHVFSKRMLGDLVKRSRYPDQVTQVVVEQIFPTIVEFWGVVLASVCLYFVHPFLAIMGVCVAIFQGGILGLSTRKNAVEQQKHYQLENKIVCTLTGAIDDIETLKAMGNHQNVYAHLMSQISEKINFQDRGNVKVALINTLPVWIQYTFAFMCFSVCAVSVISVKPLGLLVVGLGAGAFFSYMVMLVCERIESIQKLPIWVDKLNELVEDYSLEKSSTKWVVPSHFLGGVVIDDCTYAHSAYEAPLIDHVSLNIETGEHVLIIGRSGVGKSIFMKLVMGALNPLTGSIIVGNQAIQELDPVVFPYLVGYVAQSPFFFEGTIRDNLTMWGSTFSSEDLVIACKMAHIHDEIAVLPDQYDYMLTHNGSNLSGGQRQRLEIARAVLYRPPIVLLDDALTACDSGIQSIIYQNLRESGVTLIKTALLDEERSFFDRCYCLENGVLTDLAGTKQTIKVPEFVIAAMEKGEGS